MAPGSKRFTLTFVQYMGSVCFLLQIVSVEADGEFNAVRAELVLVESDWYAVIETKIKQKTT